MFLRRSSGPKNMGHPPKVQVCTSTVWITWATCDLKQIRSTCHSDRNLLRPVSPFTPIDAGARKFRTSEYLRTPLYSRGCPKRQAGKDRVEEGTRVCKGFMDCRPRRKCGQNSGMCLNTLRPKASEVLDSRARMGTVLFLLDSWLKSDVSTDITQIFLDWNLFAAKSVPDWRPFDILCSFSILKIAATE